jgi:farnesyl-diphosphate farnesyltransferase
MTRAPKSFFDIFEYCGKKIMQNRPDDFRVCEEYLSKVSRTFALNIKVLTGNVYRGILLAYLLCRIADTIEDDPQLPAQFKAQKLSQYANLFPPQPDYHERIEKLLGDIRFTEENDDSDLARDSSIVFKEFVKLPPPMIAIVSDRVKEMARGMAAILEEKKNGGIAFLENREELDNYCYYVAGTVGLMITAVFSEASARITAGIKENLTKRSVAFGLGLQITNIAKDFFGDRKRGWCYVPRSFFQEEGLDPLSSDFHDNRAAYANVHKKLIKLALQYLDEGLQYTLDIPRSLIRYRLFCAWPLFMAVETLAKLYGEESLFTGQTVKISRNDVRRIVRNTSLAAMSNNALKSMYCRISRRIDGKS